MWRQICLVEDAVEESLQGRLQSLTGHVENELPPEVEGAAVYRRFDRRALVDEQPVGWPADEGFIPFQSQAEFIAANGTGSRETGVIAIRCPERFENGRVDPGRLLGRRRPGYFDRALHHLARIVCDARRQEADRKDVERIVIPADRSIGLRAQYGSQAQVPQ